MKAIIQLPLLTALMWSVIISPLHGQVVADGATNILANVTNNSANITVGTNGSFTLLVLSNNTLLNNTVNAVIGRNASARSNEVRITGPTARWNVGSFGSLFVGSNGPASRLTITDGGALQGFFFGNVGQNVSSSNNTVLVTDPGSMFSGAILFLGGGGGNQFTVSNGATAWTGGTTVGLGAASNNLVTVTGAGSLWTNDSGLSFGSAGNRAIVSAGGKLANINGTVGLDSTANNNSVLLTDGGSTWTNSGYLRIGEGSSGNQVIASNGATVYASEVVLGLNPTARSNAVFVTGLGTSWAVRSNLYVGSNGPFSRLIISERAKVLSGTSENNYSIIGHWDSASNNVALVTDSGTVWSNGYHLYLGISSPNNQLVVSNGAAVHVLYCILGGSLFQASNNVATITGPGSLLTSRNGLDFGSAGSANGLLVSDGAAFLNGGGCRLGFPNVSASNDWVRVTGSSSVMSNTSDLVIGEVGPGNRLDVDNGGTVFANNINVGGASSSLNNRVVVNGGTLRVTNAAATGLLDIRRGTNVLNQGLIEVDILRLTNGVSSKLEFKAGTLSARSSRLSLGPPLIVGNGSDPAIFNLAGNGTHDMTGTLGLIVSSNATLSGNGSLIVQLQVLAGAQLIPGAPVGKISLSTPPFLAGTTLMELSKNIAALTNDQIQVTGTVTYGGALVVTHLGPTALAQGDKFQLFSASAYAGSFASLSLPTLTPGLSWINNLLVDGSIEVFAPPPVGAGFALNFHGTNDFVRVAHDSRLNAYPLVATAWINSTQTSGEVGLINKYAAGSLNGWHVGLFNGEVRAWYARDNANQVGNPGTGVHGGPVSDGQWHHVAFTVDNTGASLYVDGFFKEKLGWVGTPGACTTTQELSFARYPGGAGEFYQGAIEEVAIWNAEKTANEIKTNLNRGLLGSEIGLVTYHRFNEGAGLVAENAAEPTGTLTDGILQNGVTWFPGLILRPAIMTKLGTAVTVASATLHGVCNPGLTTTSTWFEWGPTTNYGSVTLAQPLGSGGGNTNFSQSLTGLTENVTYHFRAVASNIVGASFGADKSFVTTGTNLLSPRVEHTATLLPNGQVLVVGGRGQDYNPLSSAELFDPVSKTWSFTSPMSIVRYGHTATLLPNGKVLVAGGQGQDFTPAHSSSELYDPVTGTWAPTGSLATNRFGHTATLLLSGKVLVAGGSSSSSLNTIAELYDPATGNWTTSGTLVSGRYYHTTTLLPNGKVLLAGGINTNSVIVSSAELFDPISATWTNTGSMTTNRYGHTATMLRNGKVLVVGGRVLGNFLNSAELYDPVAGTWSATGAMLNYRFQHTASLLPDGKVFTSGSGIGVPSVYNPLTGTWADVPGPDPASGATATLLPSGNVLVAGGSGNFFTDFDPTAEAEVYVTPNNGSWEVTAPMANARDGHTATLLPNALVLVASYTNSEIYNPVTGTWSNTAALNSGRNNHTATLLPNGKVLVAGGNNFPIAPGVELYDMASGTWTNTGSLITNRIGGHTATLLANGKVLVTGGNGELFGPPLRNAELFDAISGTWTATGLLTTNRSGHSATLLPDGKVLIAGGLVTGGFSPTGTATAELYDPATGLWTALPSMTTIRSGHIAILLPNGKVLVAGGITSTFSAANAGAELYDPVTGNWQATGSMLTGRQGATATLLSNGKVLVAGGYNLGYLASAELYDPTTGTWTATAALGAARLSHTSTWLPTGKVLITGGSFGSGITNRAELYDVGLGFSNSWRPQITSISSPVGLGSSLILTGAQFRGLSGASGGNGSQDSPSDYPLKCVLSKATKPHSCPRRVGPPMPSPPRP